MNPAAVHSDFQRLKPDQQAKTLRLLAFLEEHCMACRVEMVGRDMVVIVGRGLASARYWQGVFTNPPLEPHKP